jgi:hypothetical protein
VTAVAAVGFAYLSPRTLRVILSNKGYATHLYTGVEIPIWHPTQKNIVIVPNIDKRYDLDQCCEHIYRLILLSKDRWRDILKLQVPILDAAISGERIEMDSKGKKVQVYIDRIENDAVAVNLIKEAAQKVHTPLPEEVVPTKMRTLNEKLDYLTHQLKVADFDRVVEQPICTYLIGEMSKMDLQEAMKALVSKGGKVAFLKAMYQWLTGAYGASLGSAAKECLWPHDHKEPDLEQVARNCKVDVGDLDFVVAICTGMQECQGG